MNTHFPTDLSQNMDNQQELQQKQASQQMVSFNMHPGFLCFFKDYVDQRGWTFYQCYQNIAKSSHEIMKIKYPIQSILNDPQKDKQQKLKQLQLRSQKNTSFAYFPNQTEGQEIECFLIQKQKKSIRQVQKLNVKLAELQKIKAKIIKKKKEQFIIMQKKRQEQLKKMQEDELKQKMRRANKVKQIQQEIRTKNQQKIMLKIKQEQQNPSNSNSCQIM